MNKWSSLLAQDSLSSAVQRELTSHLSTVIDTDSLSALLSPCQSKSDAKKRRRSFTKLNAHISEDLLELVYEELDDIEEDIGWKRSPRGKYVSKLNDWLQPFHDQIRATEEFSDLIVGGHSKHEVIYVVGSARSQQDIDAMLELLQNHDPPWKIMVNVTLPG